MPEPRPEPRSEPKIEPKPDPAVPKQQAQAEAKAKSDAQAKAAATVERRRAEEAQVAAGKAQEAAARKAEAAAAEQKQAEQAKAAHEAEVKAAHEAEVKAAHEADLRRALEDEEAGEALARSGIVDEYRTLLIQTIERNWNRPPSARAGLECTLYVTQATGGMVLDVKIGDCNGDQAVRESVSNAVYRSSPLPAPRDARAFQRKLVIVFKPME